ncbi:MAG: PAS domain-containing protein [Oceanicoccus sp.]|jgi:PAS domain-containing protein
MIDQNLSRLEALIQGLTVAVLVENGKREVIYVNSAFEEMFSVKSEQIIGAVTGGF